MGMGSILGTRAVPSTKLSGSAANRRAELCARCVGSRFALSHCARSFSSHLATTGALHGDGECPPVPGGSSRSRTALPFLRGLEVVHQPLSVKYNYSPVCSEVTAISVPWRTGDFILVFF